jgi:hypothetical protein
MLWLSQIKNFLKDSVVEMEEYNTEAGEKLSWKLELKIVKNKKETTT